MTAAGVAWGIFDTLQTSPSGTAGPVQSGTSPQASQWWEPGQTSQASQSPAAGPPPLPSSANTRAADAMGTGTTPSADVLRIVRLAISAAHADGAMNDRERTAVLEQARKAGAGELIERELASPAPLRDIVAGVTDPAAAATLYVLAFSVLRADEQVTGAERIYLAQLAHLLHLDAPTVEALEKETAQRIDTAGNEELPEN